MQFFPTPTQTPGFLLLDNEDVPQYIIFLPFNLTEK